MSDKDGSEGKMSNESKIAYITLSKDMEKIEYKISEQEKDTEFLRSHITVKQKEQNEKVAKVNDRIDAHIATETEFQQRIHKHILDKFTELDVRMSALERWKAVIYGGIVVLGTLVGYFVTQTKFDIK